MVPTDTVLERGDLIPQCSSSNFRSFKVVQVPLIVTSHWKIFQYFKISIRQFEGQLHKLAPCLKRRRTKRSDWSKKFWCDDWQANITLIGQKSSVLPFRHHKIRHKSKKPTVLFLFCSALWKVALTKAFLSFFFWRKSKLIPSKFVLVLKGPICEYVQKLVASKS